MDREWVMTEADIPALLDVISQKWKVIAPQSRDELFEFRPLEDVAELRLDYPTTMLPPSRQFLPDGEVLYTFEPGKPESVGPPELSPPIALFGVHTCDLEGISVLDEIYLSPPVDHSYANRRRRAFIVGLECERPCLDESLCADKGTFRSGRVYDMLFTPLSGGVLFIATRTGKGEHLAEECPFIHPASYMDRIRVEEFRSVQQRYFKPRYGLSAEQLTARVEGSYDDLLWVAASRLCVNCGACNTVCPTCHCFDTDDTLPLSPDDRGQRCRHWTGCQLECFAAVAGGENFRERRAYRLRHRIFKKEKYMVDRTGRSACVGCGRCGHFCPANIKLVSLYGQLAGGEVHATAS